ncbi:hypothetical protein PIB30_032439 [Stylosanthes scabra]|uniref:Uncharacterized protein n=1 Tax=Stylosanthes scabra TaxID=79078 RepID=A0ABU6QBV7_9FABA|nr:hypothetical protein [Stylosanthes scabra]
MEMRDRIQQARSPCCLRRSEPTVIDGVRAGTYHQIFHPEQLISGKEDSANNFARGHYIIVDKKIVVLCLDAFASSPTTARASRDSLFSTTPAAVTAPASAEPLLDLLLERLFVDYGKESKLGFTIYPSPQV